MKTNEFEKLVGIIIPIFVGIFNILIFLFPSDIIAASKSGISLWFNNVFPSLLPFIVGINILTAFGAISFLGTLLEPLMKPLFGVPGVGGFALITGMTSGYPLGAKVVSNLREQNEITQSEATRLAAFCNNAGPLFILGAVGVSMFGSSKIGYFVMGVHYSSAIITGLIFKYYGRRDSGTVPKNSRILSKALHNMRVSRQKDNRGFGQIMGDSVKNAMETIALVGGFIIFFSVLGKMIEITNIIPFSLGLSRSALSYFNVSYEVYEGFLLGLVEITNGARTLSLADLSDAQLAALCGAVSFGGFCIHAQAISFLSKTDIGIASYMLGKTVQCIISITTAKLLLPFFDFSVHDEAVPAFLVSEKINSQFLGSLAFSTGCFVVSISFVILISIVFGIYSSIKKI